MCRPTNYQFFQKPNVPADSVSNTPHAPPSNPRRSRNRLLPDVLLEIPQMRRRRPRHDILQQQGGLLARLRVRPLLSRLLPGRRRRGPERHLLHSHEVHHVEAGARRRAGQDKLAVRGLRGPDAARLRTDVQRDLHAHDQRAAGGVLPGRRRPDHARDCHFLVGERRGARRGGLIGRLFQLVVHGAQEGQDGGQAGEGAEGGVLEEGREGGCQLTMLSDVIF